MTEQPVFTNDLRSAYNTPETVNPSWRPLDLTGYVNGTHKAIEPTIMARTDGRNLLYAGMVHSFQGESESGKSMIAQAETARQVAAGSKCLYIDFESDAETVVPRLLMLGASPEQIVRNLHYIKPEVNPLAYPDEADAWGQLLRNRYALAIIDGVTEAFSVYGVKSIDNDEVTTWGRAVPRRIASRTGAAVVVIDHVTKSSEGRGRFAIGAQAKMSYLTGASYMVEVISPIGVGMAGKLALRVGKDRPGQVRPISGEWRKGDRTQEAAVIGIDSTSGDTIRYTVDAPRKAADPAAISSELMETVSKCIEDAPEPPSFRKINGMVSGKEQNVREAITKLQAGGYVSVVPGPRQSQLHHSLIPYRSDAA